MFERDNNSSSQARSRAVLPVTAAILAVAYAPSIAVLVKRWSGDPLYSYGFAVPVISAYIAMTKWPRSSEENRRPDYRLGLPLIAAAALLLFVGRLAAISLFESISLIVAITAAVVLLFGRPVFSRLWFALAYLLLMIPIWTDLIGRLQVPSQLISGRIAVAVFHAGGIPAVQEGTEIFLPTVTLEVLRECSGVNQLVAIFALTLPAAYLWLRGAWRRIGFVVAAVAIAYLSNGFRIALIGFLAQHGFPTTTDWVHLMEGLIVALLGYGVIGVVFSILARGSERAAPAAKPRRATPADRRRPMLDAIACGALLVAPVAASFAPSRDVGLKAELQRMPAQLGPWTRQAVSEPIEGLLEGQPDEQVIVTYRHASGERIQLVVAYQRRQADGRELAIELPRADRSRLQIDVTPALSEVNELAQRDSEGSAIRLLYWYDIDGQPFADRYRAKGWQLWNTLTSGRSNGAIIAVAWDRGSESEAAGRQARAVDFIRALLPELPKYLPSKA